MGAIQNSMNQIIGTAATAATFGTHMRNQQRSLKEQEVKRQADIAATGEQLAADKLAYKNDTIEAALAIKAHANDSYKIGKETISRTDYDAFDPEVGGKKLSEYDEKELSKVLQGLDEAGVEKLAGDVEKFRTTVLADMDTRRLTAASNLKETGTKTLQRAQTIKGQVLPRTAVNVKTGTVETLYRTTPDKHIPGKYISNKEYKNQQLDKAYEAERQLNNRIAASRQLKFDIKAATERISNLQNVKPSSGGLF